MNTGVRQDLIVVQGGEFSQNFAALNIDGTVLNLTGFTGQSLIKSSYCSEAALPNFNISILNSGTTGGFNLSMPFTGVSGLPIGINLYEVQFASGASRIKSVNGYISVYPAFI